MHDAAELDWAIDAGATLIGVNNRDLATFVTTLETTERLAPECPARGRCWWPRAASRRRPTWRAWSPPARTAILVGEAFMAKPDPGAALRGAALGER